MGRSSDLSKEAWREYQVLSEVRDDEYLSQRKLSDRLGFAVASTNQVLKRLVRKGCITTRRINGKSLAYSVTPKGLSTMLYHVINYTRQTISVFSEVRALVRKRLENAKCSRGIRTVAVVGTGELAEAVYLSVQEAQLELVAAYASQPPPTDWFGHTVQPLTPDPAGPPADIVVATEPHDMGSIPAYASAVTARGREVIDVYQLLSERLSRFARHMAQE